MCWKHGATWQTVESLDELKKDSHDFAWGEMIYFFIFRYAIYWMKLERFFSMLAQSQHCLLFSCLSRRQVFLQMLGLQVIIVFLFVFLVVPSQLPTILNSSLVIIRFMLLYFYNMCRLFSFYLVIHVWISAKWSRFSTRFPLHYVTKLYKTEVNVCKHHKCFILPMHRLGCWKETVAFCAGTCLCNISWVCFVICVYLIATASSGTHLLCR